MKKTEKPYSLFLRFQTFEELYRFVIFHIGDVGIYQGYMLDPEFRGLGAVPAKTMVLRGSDEAHRPGSALNLDNRPRDKRAKRDFYTLCLRFANLNDLAMFAKHELPTHCALYEGNGLDPEFSGRAPVNGIVVRDARINEFRGDPIINEGVPA
jgi:hypothetical protein